MLDVYEPVTRDRNEIISVALKALLGMCSPDTWMFDASGAYPVSFARNGRPWSAIGTTVSSVARLNRTGIPQDERSLLPLFSPYIEETEISNLPAFNYYAKLSAIRPQEPLSGITLLLEDDGSSEIVSLVIKLSRATFARKQGAAKKDIEKPVLIKTYRKNKSDVEKSKSAASAPVNGMLDIEASQG